MKHSLQISVSKKPERDGLPLDRQVSAKEQLMNALFGTTRKLTIIVPADSVDCITISEGAAEGGEVNAT